MPEVLELPVATGVDSVSAPADSGRARQLAALRPYQFKVGDAANPAKTNPRAHRQKGSRNAETVYLESLPRKAAQWVKSTAPAVLIDARKIALPIDSDAPPTVNLHLAGWFEQRLAASSPKSLDTPQEYAPLSSSTTRMGSPDAAAALPLPLSPTLPPSAATEEGELARGSVGSEAAIAERPPTPPPQ